jgi:oxygen-independent coproporphyrinogen-3 oxidase
MEEFMFLGLRLVEGVSTIEFERLFGKEIREVYGEVIDKYLAMGLLEYLKAPVKENANAARADLRLRLTDKGLDVSNTVMAEFLL